MYRRFTGFLKIPEQYVYAFISPTMFFSLSIKPLVYLELSYYDGKKLSKYSQNTNVVILNTLKSTDDFEFWNVRSIHNTLFALKYLELSNMQISTHLFLSMLSPKITCFSIKSVTFSTPITFRDIISQTPNLEWLNDIDDCNVIFNDDWPLLLIKYCKKLKSIIISTSFAFTNSQKLLKLVNHYYKTYTYKSVCFLLTFSNK